MQPIKNGNDDKVAVISYTQTFYNHLPFYLAIGMTSDEYWNGDCLLVKAYRKADKIKEERINQRLWLQGMYFYEALCDVSPLLQAFAKKGTKPVPYSSEPYAISKEEVEKRKQKQEQLRYEKTKAKMAMWAMKTNIQINNRSEGGVENG